MTVKRPPDEPVKDGSTVEPFLTRHFAIFWAIIGALTAIWRFTTPYIYNRAAIGRLLVRDWEYAALRLIPSFDVAPDSLILLHSGASILLCLGVVVLPSCFARRITRWTVISSFVIFCFCLTMSQLYYVPFPPSFWNALLLVGILLPPFVVLKKERFVWLSAPFFGERPSEKRPKPYRLFLLWFIPLVSLLDIYWFIPSVAGMWKGDVLAELWEHDIVLTLLNMKNHASPLHERLVEILAEDSNYVLLKLPKDTYTVDDVTTQPAKDTPLTQPADDWTIHWNLPAPMVVRQSEIESQTYAFSEKAIREAIWDEHKLDAMDSYRVVRKIRDGLEISFRLPKKGLTNTLHIKKAEP